MARESRSQALRLALLYLLFGVVWIFGTDLLVDHLISGEAATRRIQTAKGWLFVVASTGLLYVLIRRYGAEREEALQAARTRGERLGRAQEIAKLGSWEYDFRNDALHWSDEVYEIFGVRPGEQTVSRDAFYSFVHPDDLEEQKAADAAVERGEGPLDNEHRIVRSDGEIRHVHERAVLEEDEEGRPVRLRGTVQDVTERKRLELQLERSRNLLRDYARRLMSERENERDTLARDIHDHLGQLLTAVKLQLDRQLSDGGQVEVSGLRESVELVKECIREVRAISSALRPPDLDQLGLVDALAASVERFEERTGVSASFDSTVPRVSLGREESAHVYRIVQEALTNVARHAGADHARVRIDSRNHHLVLEVRDDGAGLDRSAEEIERSHGIVGMRERARILHGDFEIRNRTDGGVAIRVTVPLRERAGG